MYQLDDCDETFLRTAPHRFSYTYDLPVPADQVWASLTSDEGVAAWTPLLSTLRWTSPRPFGVGTTREITMPAKALALRERFFVWEEGRRHSFHATASTRPFFRRFAEDYVVEPTSTGSRFTWTFAFEPRRGFGTLLSLGRPITALLLGRMAGSARTHFAQLVR